MILPSQNSKPSCSSKKWWHINQTFRPKTILHEAMEGLAEKPSYMLPHWSQPLVTLSFRQHQVPSSVCCILCAERDYTVFLHEQDTSLAKFNNGKPAWAKFTNKSLRSPDDGNIHSALSWTCCNWPTDAWRFSHCCSTTSPLVFQFHWLNSATFPIHSINTSAPRNFRQNTTPL